MVESFKLNDITECPLCGCKEHMNKSHILYGHQVCMKCFYGFTTRRYTAYAIDELLIMLFLFASLQITAILLKYLGGNEYVILLLLPVLFIFFSIKDGFGGYSLGKAILGLRVINENNGKPIGLWQSIRRNFPTFNGYLFIRICFELPHGHRTGDERGQSKVIWKKYSSCPVFLPKCLGGFDWPKAKREEKVEKKIDKKGEKVLAKAIKTEIKGNWDEAIMLYEKIISDYPSTEVSHNAKIAMKALKDRIY